MTKREGGGTWLSLIVVTRTWQKRAWPSGSGQDMTKREWWPDMTKREW